MQSSIHSLILSPLSRVASCVSVANSVPLTSSICCEALPSRQTDWLTIVESADSCRMCSPIFATHFNSLFPRPAWNSYYLSFIHAHDTWWHTWLWFHLRAQACNKRHIANQHWTAFYSTLITFNAIPTARPAMRLIHFPCYEKRTLLNGIFIFTTGLQKNMYSGKHVLYVVCAVKVCLTLKRTSLFSGQLS